MAENSSIEWTDATWNPVTGCTKVTPGCDNCYAETFAERWRGTPGHYFENGFDVTLRPGKLNQPLRWRKARRVFVNSMSDLFHEKVPDSYIVEVFAVMALTPQHTYQLLTKRHGRMRSLLNQPEFWYQVGRKARHLGYEYDSAANYFADGRNIYDTAVWEGLRHLDNVWLGVSVEDQKRADLRIPALLDTPAAMRFLSCEPLLGPVDLTEVAPGLRYANRGFTALAGTPRIDWVIVGGESGPGARPMDPAWARSLREQCVTAGVSFFFKQWGSWAPTGKVGLGWPFPGETFVGEPIDARGFRAEMRRMPKKAAGRELDGRTWDEFPQPAEVLA
jgi:protein gp37